MKQKFIVLLLLLSIFIFDGCTIQSKKLPNESNNKTEDKIENKHDNKNIESEYIDIKYSPYTLGMRAKENLGQEAVKFYVEILIPGVLKRDKEIIVPSTLTDNEKSLVTNYFQQNCPLEYFAGTPFFNVKGDTILFDYSNCINMTDEEYENEINKMSRAIENIINTNIKKDYNYMDRVLALYSYLSQNTFYNKEAISTDAYGVLVNKEGICGGFAQSMQILLSQLHEDEGYQVEWMSDGDREGHVWNVLLINGDWYYFDTTWENGDDDGQGLKFFAMDINRRDVGSLPRNEYTMCPLSLTISVPICDNDKFSILQYCSEYKLNLDKHKVDIKNDNDNKWYVLDTINYSIKEK